LLLVHPECEQCEWPRKAKKYEEELIALRGEVEELKRIVYGRRSERMPTVSEELRRHKGARRDPEQAMRRRQEHLAAKKDLPERIFKHDVPPGQRYCPHCKSTDLIPLGDGRESTVYEYVPAKFERHVHLRETLACKCGQYVVTAEVVPKVVDKGQYGPGFVAHLVTSKCGDSIPFYRMEKQYKRIGVPIARSTMVDLFHAAAGSLRPLYDRLLYIIAHELLVQADETTMRVQDKGKTHKSYLWTFLSGNLIAYKYSATRSGETPSQVLGATEGTLVVDAYTGYNPVCDTEARTRAGCWSHVRRKYFDALSTSPQAQQMLDLILELFMVEREACDGGFAGTERHLEMRRTRSQATIDAIHKWIETEEPKHLPKGPLGKAIAYTKNNWESLTRFLDEAKTPIHNNASESALRVAALGRKNYLFVGHDEAGQNTAILYSLVSTCEALGVNPLEYLADVLIRIQDYPQSRIDELLPQNWKAPPQAEAVA
jgi:transposase